MKTITVDDVSSEPLVQAELRERTVPKLFDPQGASIDPTSMSVYDFAMAHRSSPAAYLRHLQSVYVYNDVVFIVDEAECFEPLASSWHWEERPARGHDFLDKAAQAYVAGPGLTISRGFFIGSAGSSNYGHWLIDDFPRGIVAKELAGSMPIIYTTFAPEIDAIKVETLNMLRPESDHISIDRSTLVFVADLYFVEPISRHPLIKSRAAIAAMKEFVLKGGSSTRRKIFINRRSGRRKIKNTFELERWLFQNDFIIVNAEDLTFRQQIEAFQSASLVVGIMGAAMTNIVFCEVSTPVIFLSPSGWDEPFYWDLCDSVGLDYAVMYGETDDAFGMQVHLSDFRINVNALNNVVNEVAGPVEVTLDHDRGAKATMERHEVVQAAVDRFAKARYLEIGVNQGHTFHLVKADEKVGVDPAYLFDVVAAQQEYPENTYHVKTSDEFFRDSIGVIPKFDVIFIDGLHCFDQVLRDFVNSAEMIADNGIIIIDDVMPRDFISSLPSIDMMFAMRKAENSADATWMGDVYKLIFFIASFMPAFSYGTVEENHGQTICWRSMRATSFQNLKDVVNLDFTDVVLGKKILNILPLESIMNQIRKDQGEVGVWRG